MSRKRLQWCCDEKCKGMLSFPDVVERASPPCPVRGEGICSISWPTILFLKKKERNSNVFCQEHLASRSRTRVEWCTNHSDASWNDYRYQNWEASQSESDLCGCENWNSFRFWILLIQLYDKDVINWAVWLGQHLSGLIFVVVVVVAVDSIRELHLSVPFFFVFFN